MLFDWGNVLCEYRPHGFGRLADALGADPVEVGDFVGGSGLLAALVTGAVSPEAGLSQLADRFGTALTRAQAAACFRTDVERELPGARALVDELRGRCRLAVLSNTFFGHWDHFVTTELYAQFDLPMASHLLGAAKPDPAIYAHALGRMGAPASAVVFVDDKPENVAAAQRAGMHALHSLDVATTRRGLAALLDA